MKIKTRHEIMLIGFTSLALYFVFPRLMLIATTSSWSICDFCLSTILDPQGGAYRRVAKTLTGLIFFGGGWTIVWASRLLLAVSLRTIRRFMQQHSQQASSTP